jgi:Asp-tRNA(Asn)/Glu-tRNA(Gln) amidotransferase C subunit
MGDDEPRPSLSPEEVLANAPLEHDGYLRVRAVLDE